MKWYNSELFETIYHYLTLAFVLLVFISPHIIFWIWGLITIIYLTLESIYDN